LKRAGGASYRRGNGNKKYGERFLQLLYSFKKTTVTCFILNSDGVMVNREDFCFGSQGLQEVKLSFGYRNEGCGFKLNIIAKITIPDISIMWIIVMESDFRLFLRVEKFRVWKELSLFVPVFLRLAILFHKRCVNKGKVL